MKLSELKPCAGCGGKLLNPPIGNWYVIDETIAMVNPQSAREVMGLNMMFNGALGLAEVMAPAADKAVLICGDEDPGLRTRFHICLECYMSKPLAEIVERSQKDVDSTDA